MIEAVGLTKRYGDITAVDDLTFSVEPGQVTGFLGPNGAGKSTTMRLVLGLDRPTSGTVTVEGKPFVAHHDPLRRVGALLEARSVHPARTARDHLLAERRGRSQGDDGPRRVILRHTVRWAVRWEVMMSKRTSKVLAVSVPPELARDFEAIADAEGRNRSELFREMLRVYRAYREIGEFETLQRYGAAQARAAGVSSEEDVARLIAEVRGE